MLVNSACIAAILVPLLSISKLALAEQRQGESKWDYSLEHRVSRCFKTNRVTFDCNSDVIPGTGMVTAELEILATDVNGKKYAYGYGKSVEGDLCKRHLAKIREIIKNQSQVCITGDGENALDGEIYSRWQELETRAGSASW